MKRKFKIFFTLALSVLLSVNLPGVASIASSSSITKLTASYSSGKVSVTGESSDNVHAVALMIYKGDTLLRLETVGVAQNNFCAAISITLSSGTYTLKAANYEGGEYYTTTFSVPNSSNNGGGSSALSPSLSPDPTTAPRTPTPKSVTTTSTDGLGNNTTQTVTTLTDNFGNNILENRVTTVNTITNSVQFSVTIESDGSSAPLSLDILNTAASSDNSSATIITKEGSIVFDNETLNGIKKESDNENFNVFLERKDIDILPDKIKNQANNAIIFELKIVSDTKVISEFSGTVAVSIVAPDECEDKIIQLYYINDDGHASLVEGRIVVKNNIRYYEFKTNYFSFYAIRALETLPFGDVHEAEYWYDSIYYVCAKGLFSGTSQTDFIPEGNMTRGMLVTVLYRLEGLPTANYTNSFTDVQENSWYKDAIMWASNKGIVSGYAEGIFAPDDPVLREQIAVILYNYAKYKGYSVTSSIDLENYTDASDIDTWALTAMKWVNAEGIIVGTSSTTLSPLEAAKRGQVATILKRFIENTAE